MHGSTTSAQTVDASPPLGHWVGATHGYAPSVGDAAPAKILYAMFSTFCTLSESLKSPVCPAGPAATELPCIPLARAVHSPALSHSLPVLYARWLQPGHVNNDRPFPRLSSLLHRSLDLASNPNSKPVSLRDPPGAAKANQRAIFVFQAWARNDSRKAQPGLMELCLCCASKPTFGSGAAWLGRDAAVFAEGNSSDGGGEGRKEKQKMKENEEEEEEGQPGGCSQSSQRITAVRRQHLAVQQVSRGQLGLQPRAGAPCPPASHHRAHPDSLLLSAHGSQDAVLGYAQIGLGCPPQGWGSAPGGPFVSPLPWWCVTAVCPSVAELCCVAPPAFSPLVMVLRSWLPALLPKHTQPSRKHF